MEIEAITTRAMQYYSEVEAQCETNDQLLHVPFALTTFAATEVKRAENEFKKQYTTVVRLMTWAIFVAVAVFVQSTVIDWPAVGITFVILFCVDGLLNAIREHYQSK